MRRTALLMLVAVLSACATPQPEPEAPPAPVPVPVPKPVVRDIPPPPPQLPRLTVAAVGDIMPGTDYPVNRLPDDDGASFFAGVSEWLSGADIAFGNFEGTLVDGGEPAKVCKDPALCYLFRTPTRYARHLADAGFDVLSLANNHAGDFGEAGRSATMAALDAVGIAHSGRVGDTASITVRGVRVAMIAFSPNVGTLSINDIDVARVEVSRLAAEHDVVIVSFHGGAEGLDATRVPFGEEFYYGEARGDVVRFSHAVIDAGADLVFGHGPHVPRALELYAGRLIAYSLGNFATYYGISVAGIKGIAPLLLATIEPDGRFVHGHIVATRQLRPAGPTLDPNQRALTLMHELSAADFPGNLVFDALGHITIP